MGCGCVCKTKKDLKSLKALKYSQDNTFSLTCWPLLSASSRQSGTQGSNKPLVRLLLCRTMLSVEQWGMLTAPWASLKRTLGSLQC